MKKIKSISIYLLLVLLTTIIYFQSWMGPFKNWKQIKDIEIYQHTNNEMLVADANYFLNSKGDWLSVNTPQIELSHFAASQYSLLYQGFINLLTSLTQQAQLAVNLFDILGYVLLVVVAFKTLIRLKIKTGTAFVFALLYCFGFYHQTQSSSLMMGWYFSVPIYCYLAFKILSEAGQNLQPQMQHFLNQKRLLLLACLTALLMPFLGVAYSVIGTSLIMASLIIFAISSPQLRKKALLFSLIYLLLSYFSTTWVLDFNQQILGQMQGHYPTIAEVELNSFKYTHLLLPNPFHRIPSFSYLAHEYLLFFSNTESNLIQLLPVNADNVNASLGVLASVGMVIIILWALFALFAKPSNASEVFDKTNDVLPHPFRLASTIFPVLIVLLFLGGLGALASVVAWFTPKLGIEWYRASPFIAFYALFFMAASLQFLAQKITHSSVKIGYPVVLIIICILGLMDQSPSHCGQCRFNKEAVFKQHNKVVNSLPTNALSSNQGNSQEMWMQLPQPVLFQNSPSSLHFLNLENTILKNPNLNSIKLAQTQTWKRFKKVLPLLDLKDQVILAKYLHYTGLIIQKNNWCNWSTESVQLASELEKMQNFAAASIVKTNDKKIDDIAIELKGEMTAEQTQRAVEVLSSWGFIYAQNQLTTQFDYTKAIDFSTDSRPSYVKNIRGLLGEGVHVKGFDPIQDQCFYSSGQTPTGSKKPDYLYGELFLNPLIDHVIAIELHEKLSSSFDLLVNMEWRKDRSNKEAFISSQVDEVEIEVQFNQQIKKVKLNAEGLSQSLHFDVNPTDLNDAKSNFIQIHSDKPVASLKTIKSAPYLNGVIVLRSMAIKPSQK